jgi:hypothetical protein
MLKGFAMAKNKKPTAKKPPRGSIQSVQYDLFSQFITNDQSKVSNTVEVWESIPKYFFTPRQVEKLRTPTGHADPYKREYEYNGISCTVKVQPALIEQEDGTYKAYFPSITEELIEEALKKILTYQNQGIHDPGKSETWVRFSLRMLQRELKTRGRGRSLNQIKHAIQVMSKCNISLFKGKKEVWNGSILQDLVTIDREEYIEDPNAYHIARLPLFISHAINQLEYRQFNYDRLMRCNEQLTRWLYKRLIHRYRQASLIDTYHFLFSDVAQGSGLLQQGRESRNREKVFSALDELQEKSIILSYKAQETKKGRKITDVKYTIIAAPDFIREQKAANKRAKLQLVDKTK